MGFLGAFFHVGSAQRQARLPNESSYWPRVAAVSGLACAMQFIDRKIAPGIRFVRLTSLDDGDTGGAEVKKHDLTFGDDDRLLVERRRGVGAAERGGMRDRDVIVRLVGRNVALL